MYPNLFQNFKRAFIPLMDQSMYSHMATINERVAQVNIDRTIDRNCIPPSSKDKTKRKRSEQVSSGKGEEEGAGRLRTKPFVVTNTSDFDR